MNAEKILDAMQYLPEELLLQTDRLRQRKTVRWQHLAAMAACLCLVLGLAMGLEQVADMVDAMFEGEMPCDGSILTNARQYDAIRRAHDAMNSALKALKLGLTPDAVLTDVEAAMEAMGEVTGATVREDITARIFERFCVGK